MDAGLVDHYEKKHFEAARLSKCDAEQKEGDAPAHHRSDWLFQGQTGTCVDKNERSR